MGKKVLPVLVFTSTPGGRRRRSSNAVPNGSSRRTSSVTLVIVCLIPVTVTIHSAVAYVSASSGVKRISMRFSPGPTTPPQLCLKRNEPGTTMSVPWAFASPPLRSPSRYLSPTYPSAGSVGGVVMTVLVSGKSSP